MNNVLGRGVEDVNGGREVNTLCNRPIHGEAKSCTELAQEVKWTAESRSRSAVSAAASFVGVTLSTGPETKGSGVVVVAREAEWSSVGTASVCVSMPALSTTSRAPESTGTVVVAMAVAVEVIRSGVRAMTVAVEVIRPRARAVTVSSLAAHATKGTWSMVTRTSMALVLEFSAVAVAVVAVVVGRVRVRCRGFDVLFRALGELADCLGRFRVL